MTVWPPENTNIAKRNVVHRAFTHILMDVGEAQTLTVCGLKLKMSQYSNNMNKRYTNKMITCLFCAVRRGR